MSIDNVNISLLLKLFAPFSNFSILLIVDVLDSDYSSDIYCLLTSSILNPNFNRFDIIIYYDAFFIEASFAYR